MTPTKKVRDNLFETQLRAASVAHLNLYQSIIYAAREKMYRDYPDNPAEEALAHAIMTIIVKMPDELAIELCKFLARNEIINKMPYELVIELRQFLAKSLQS